MTEIKSELTEFKGSQEELYEFLHNLNNHQKIMPDQVTEWWSTESEAKLRIQGIGSLHLQRGECLPHHSIKIVPLGKPPVELFLHWSIFKKEAGTSFQVVLHAELNMMLKMIAQKPLQNLTNYMAAHVNGAFENKY
ncbi:MAG: SRPBCC family protein [Flavobacteriales bacterium]|nr:SRPBCC family protein [Flavobacteriales bacterium]